MLRQHPKPSPIRLTKQCRVIHRHASPFCGLYLCKLYPAWLCVSYWTSRGKQARRKYLLATYLVRPHWSWPFQKLLLLRSCHADVIRDV